MTKKKDKQATKYSSFSQWKNKYFPELVEERSKKDSKVNAGKLGSSLANESFEKVLRGV